MWSEAFFWSNCADCIGVFHSCAGSSAVSYVNTHMDGLWSPQEACSASVVSPISAIRTYPKVLSLGRVTGGDFEISKGVSCFGNKNGCNNCVLGLEVG